MSRDAFIRAADGPGARLKTHQEETLESLRKAWETATLDRRTFRGVIQLPTGGGKTFAATWFLVNDILLGPKPSGGHVLWIAHRAELLSQAREAFSMALASRGAASGPRELRALMISGALDHSPVSALAAVDIVIASIQALSRGHQEVRAWASNLRSPLVVVIDEAHHAAAASYLRVLDAVGLHPKRIVADGRRHLLGLTATPFRTQEAETPALHRIFDVDATARPPHGAHVKLEALVKRGFLARPHIVTRTTSVSWRDLESQGLTERERKYIATYRTLPERLLRLLWESSDGCRDELILNTYREMRDKGVVADGRRRTARKAIVFCIDVAHAHELAHRFDTADIRVEVIVGDTPMETRKGLRETFAKPDGPDVLFSVTVLTEGVDIPAVEMVILARPTQSRILFQQMVGRALRGTDVNGTEHAFIVDIVDDIEARVRWVHALDVFPTPEEDSTVWADARTPRRRDPVKPAWSGDSIRSPADALDEVLGRLLVAKTTLHCLEQPGLYLLRLPADDPDAHASDALSTDADESRRVIWIDNDARPRWEALASAIIEGQSTGEVARAAAGLRGGAANEDIASFAAHVQCHGAAPERCDDAGTDEVAAAIGRACLAGSISRAALERRILDAAERLPGDDVAAIAAARRLRVAVHRELDAVWTVAL